MRINDTTVLRKSNLYGVLGSIALGIVGFGCTTTRQETVRIPTIAAEPLRAEAILNLSPSEVLPVASGEKRLDAWWETYLICGTATKGGDITQTPHWSIGWQKLAEDMPFSNNPSKNKTGDFGVVFEAARAKSGTYAVGLHTGPFLQPWKLDSDWNLQLWLKGEGMSNAPALALVDAKGKRATATLENFTPDSKWHELDISLKSFKADAGFNFGAVHSVQFEKEWPQTARFSMDGVRFCKGDQEIGVTDKNLTQRLGEARRTRLLRTHESIINSPELIGESGMQKKRKMVYLSEFGLWPRKGLDLAQANAQLNETLSRILQNKEWEEWAGIVQPTWYGLYWNFSSKSSVFPGRLSPDNEELILKIIWESNIYANDIHFARFPSLWVWSSENHDGAWRLKGLLSSAVLNDVPKYKNRLFPDLGIELGTPTANKPSFPIHPDAPEEYFPRPDKFGPHADGKQHSVAEHYEVWTDLWHRYMTDRAKVNFFLEEAGGYRIALIRNIYTAYLYGRDPDLTKRAGMFLDMYWLKYAHNYLAGMRGGPKRRSNLSEYDGKISPYVTFHLGGPATDTSIGYWMHPAAEALLCDYDLPRVVWKMMLDKKGLGDFVFEARGLAEENDVLPRPAGTGKIFMLDGKQRSVRYRYNTPYYLMSTLMESPNMLHTYLGPSKFSQGLMVPWEGARILPLRSGYSYNTWGKMKENQMHSVQDKNVFVGYTNPMHQRRSPDHFPNTKRKCFISEKKKALDVFRFGGEIMIKGWDKVVEKEGWVFAKSGSAYGAARIVVPEYDDRGNPSVDPKVHGKLILQTNNSHYWNDERTVIGNKTSDVMIIEAGSEEEHGSFEEFCEAILKNKLHVWKAHHGYVLVYRGSRKDAKEIVLNLENPHVPPKLDGEPVNYEIPWTVKTPYMESKYKSGVIKAQFGNEKLELDFNDLTRKEK